MEIEKAIQILETYNQWRRGTEIPQPNPKEIGEAIDIAIRELKPIEIMRNLSVKYHNENTAKLPTNP